MLKSAGCALALFIVSTIMAPIAAHADTIAYNLVLTGITGPSGTGSFSVTGPLVTTIPSTQDFTPGNGLISLDFILAGHDFSLATAVGTPHVTFQNGSLFNIQYQGQISGTGFSFSIQANGGQYLYGDAFHPTNSGVGTIAASPAPVAVPGPIVGAGLPGLIAAAGGLIALARRRKSPRSSLRAFH